MRLAIVGSRSLAGSPRALGEIFNVIMSHQTLLTPGEELVIISGGAVGVDQMAESVARRQGVAVKVFLPSTTTWLGRGGYKERNQKIADNCDELVCIVDPGSKTKGSEWTRDAARRQGKPTLTIYVRPGENTT